MSVTDSPFPRDETLPARLAARDGDKIRAEAEAALQHGLILSSDTVAGLVARHGLSDAEELGLLLLPVAETVAHPPISNFYVGAVGVAKSGEIILGGNQEWPGAPLAYTIHGEGMLAIRAFHLGLDLAAIAIFEAHPCAHCRQCLVEYQASSDLVVIDPHGHRLTLDQLYPWPFSPDALGVPGADPSVTVARTVSGDAPAPVLALIKAQAGRAHSPYSGAPAAVVLETDAGLTLGVTIESVSFNPTMHPLMCALVNLTAEGASPDDIRAAWLVQPTSGVVDYIASTRELLTKVAGDVPLHELEWRA